MEEKGMIRFDRWLPELPGEDPRPGDKKAGRHARGPRNAFFRDYGILLGLLMGAALLTLFIILFAYFRDRATEKRVYQEIGIEKGQTVMAVWIGEGTPPVEKILEVQDGQTVIVVQTVKADQESYAEALKAVEDPIAQHVAGLRQKRKCTKAGAETYAWVDIAILESGKYGNSLTDFIADPGRIEGYYVDVFVREEDREIAQKVAEMYMSKKFPNGFTTDYQFAVINSDGSVTARTEYKVTPNTKFWEVEG